MSRPIPCSPIAAAALISLTALILSPTAAPSAADAHPTLVVQAGADADNWRLTFSADGKTLVSGGSGGFSIPSTGDDRVHLWDVATGALKEVIHTGGSETLDVILSPDGGRLATSSRMQKNTPEQTDTIQIWDARSGALLRTLDPRTYIGFFVAFSPDWRILVTYSSDDKNLALWDTRTWQLIRTLTLPTVFDEAVYTMHFSADGRTVEAGLSDRAMVWDLRTGALQRQFTWPRHEARPECFSPDGSLLAVSGGQGYTMAKVLNMQTGIATYVPKGGEPTASAAFSPDGNTILWVCDYGTICLTDVRTRKIVWSFRSAPSYPRAGAFSPDGKTVAVGYAGGSNIVLVSARTGQILRKLSLPGSPVELTMLTRDGSMLLTEHGGGGGLISWNARSGNLRRVLKGVRSYAPFVTPADIPSASSDARSVVFQSGATLQITDLATGQTRVLADGSAYKWYRPSLSPDGRYVAVGYRPIHDQGNPHAYWPQPVGTMVLEAASGRILKTIGAPESGVEEPRAIFSPDSHELALFKPQYPMWSNSNEPIEVWDWRAARRVGTYRVSALPNGSHLSLAAASARRMARKPMVPDEPYECVLFTPDGTELARQHGYNTVVIWKIGASAKRSIHIAEDPIRSIAFSPDASTIACGNSTGVVTLASAADGKVLHILRPGAGSLRTLAFAPGGRTLVAGGEDGRITWWDTATGHLLLTSMLFPGNPPGDWIAYTPDGYYTGSANVDRYVRWRVDGRLLPASTYSATYHRSDVIRRALERN